MKPVIIGIAGGSGSGKSTVTKQLMNLIDPEKTLILRQDNYYKDQSDLPYDERIKTNYDHPFAFDNELLVQHIMELKDNKIIEVPEYDFTVHNRKKKPLQLFQKKLFL